MSRGNPVIALETGQDAEAISPWRSLVAAVAGGRLTVAIVWNITGAVFNQGSTFLLGIIVAERLGRESYGAFGFLQGTLLMFSNQAQLALGFAATKYVAEFRVNDAPRAGKIIVLCAALSALTGGVATVIAIAAARPIAVTLAHQPALESVIRLGAPAIAFVALSATLTGALAGMGRFRSIAFAGVVSGVAYVALCAAGAIRWGLNGVAGGLSLSALFQCLLTLIILRRAAGEEGIPLPAIVTKPLFSERSVLLKTALPAALSGVTTLPTLWLITAILARQNHGMSLLALFTAANSLRILVSFVPALINNVGFSVLSSHKGSADDRGYWNVFRANLIMVTGVALAGAAFIAIAGVPVLRLFGQSFVSAYPILLILLIPTLADAIAISFYQIIQTHGNMWLSVFGVALPRDIVIVALALRFAPRLGAVGLAIAITAGSMTTLTSVLLIVARTRRSVGKWAEV
jgi:O-antigen/teichoic acid export membrane protein